jgi:hypothetical protein
MIVAVASLRGPSCTNAAMWEPAWAEVCRKQSADRAFFTFGVEAAEQVERYNR